MNNDDSKLSFKIADRPLSTLMVYNTGTHRCAPGYCWGPGVCDHYLFHYVISGQGHYQTQSQTYQLQAGDLFLIRPDELISYAAHPQNPWTYCWVGFQGPDAITLLRQTDFAEHLTAHIPDGPQLQRLLQDIVDSRGSEPHAVARMTGKLYAFLAHLIEHASEKPQAKRPSTEEHLRRACAYIATHYARPITVQDIASHVGLSRSQLYRAFEAQLHYSPTQYLTRFRMAQAKVLLRKGKLSIKEVAYSVGFEDPLYFSKRFKEVVGKTPGQYAGGSQTGAAAFDGKDKS